jgi:radical SAM superfamily enzyme YgiQ (UPF0313 family)
VETAFPGTPLYKRYLEAGRLIEPRNWRKCSLFDVNFYPAQMTAARLEQKFAQLVAELYSPEAVAKRHRRFMKVYGPKFRRPTYEPCPVEA